LGVNKIGRGPRNYKRKGHEIIIICSDL